jgi:hypothetical protein
MFGVKSNLVNLLKNYAQIKNDFFPIFEFYQIRLKKFLILH